MLFVVDVSESVSRQITEIISSKQNPSVMIGAVLFTLFVWVYVWFLFITFSKAETSSDIQEDNYFERRIHQIRKELGVRTP